MQQIHCYPTELFRYYGNAATRYATGTVTLPWKCNKLIITQQQPTLLWKCRQGLIYHNT
jgi:hypothetical protein